MQASDDPYERFILQHLQHYGLFTDRGSASALQTSLSPRRRRSVRRESILLDVINTAADSNDSYVEEEELDEGLFSPALSLHLGKVLGTRQLLIRFDGERPVPRLREPQNLFAIPSDPRTLQGVRWPIECHVIKDEIQHLEWDPPEPEPFYQSTGQEQTPLPVGEDRGRTVYCIDPATKSSYFTCSRVGGHRGPLPSAIPRISAPPEPPLEFESRFESGNLQKAVQVGLHDYELTLRCDLYTTKHTQWFYFRVRRMKPGVTYRFTIINLMKSSSLYGSGMRPLLYSECAARQAGQGWARVGTDIRYYRNDCQEEGRSLYSLTWTLQFPHEGDTCYLAHCYPYTYSHLRRYLAGVLADPVKAALCRPRVLCRSLGGNPVYVLTVTAVGGGWQERRARRAVVVTARVHPGETNSSWMMQGFLDFLLGDSPDAQLLRDTFVFKVVPMLNPDGVVVGNYRCSLAGRDLNRNYRTLLRESFPCVWYTRSMVKRLAAEREVVLYCDLHGHSRKNNVFMYGCEAQEDKALRLHERVFPLMMSKNTRDKFSFQACKFKVQRGKEGTGRVVMWRLGVRNSYTMEATFGGSTLGNRKGTHFTTRDLRSIGFCLCDTLLDFCDPDPSKVACCLAELRQALRRKLGREADSDGSMGSLSMSDIESSTSGSNSTESDGLPVHLLNRNNQENQHKKKHLKSRKERNRLRQERAYFKEPKETLPPSEDDKMKEEKKTIPAMKDKTKRQKVPFAVRVTTQTGRPWVPHPVTRIGVVGQLAFWEDKPGEKAYVEAVTSAYLRHAQAASSLRQTSSDDLGRVTHGYTAPPVTQRQTHHHPLIVTAVQQRCPSGPGEGARACGRPVQQYPLPFDPHIRPHAGIRGRLPVSMPKLQLADQAVVFHAQGPRRSAHRYPAQPLGRAKPAREVLTQVAPGPPGYCLSDPLDAMATLNIKAGYPTPETVLSHGTEGIGALLSENPLSKHVTDGLSALPDLKNLHSKSLPWGDQVRLKALRLGRLPGSGPSEHCGDTEQANSQSNKFRDGLEDTSSRPGASQPAQRRRVCPVLEGLPRPQRPSVLNGSRPPLPRDRAEGVPRPSGSAPPPRTGPQI